MIKGLVSVMTPCYNGESYIGRFLESILSQTYKNIELIIINDGSTDETENIILSYKEKFLKRNIELEYIYQENAGQSAAINKGLSIAKGEFLTWPDSDDIIYPENMERKVRALEEYPCCAGVVVQGNKVIEDNLCRKIGKLKIVHKKNEENIFKNLIFEKGIYFAPAGYMIRSDAFFEMLSEKGIYVSDCGQNWQMLLPVAYKYNFCFIDEILFDYVVRKSSHSRKEKSFEDKISKTYIHEDCLKKTIERIRMITLEEKQKLYFEIELKYIRRRMQFAKEYNKINEFECFFKELSSKSTLEKEDYVLKRRMYNKFYDLFIKVMYKIRHIIHENK